MLGVFSPNDDDAGLLGLDLSLGLGLSFPLTITCTFDLLPGETLIAADLQITVDDFLNLLLPLDPSQLGIVTTRARLRSSARRARSHRPRDDDPSARRGFRLRRPAARLRPVALGEEPVDLDVQVDQAALQRLDLRQQAVVVGF